MYVDATDDNSNSIASFMQTIADSTSTILGHVRISEKSNTNDFILFQITNVAGQGCLLYTSPSPRDRTRSRMPSSA